MRRPALFCAFVAAVAATAITALPASSQTVAARRSQLEQAGERLSRVTEDYNEARLRRSSLDAKLNDARGALARSDSRLASVRKDLGEAVRDMYMHRGAGIDAFFQAKSFGELSRGNALRGRVALTADELILQIRKVRAERSAVAGQLNKLRDRARASELTIAKQKRSAAAALDRSQALLARANVSALDAARRSRLDAAAVLADSRIKSAGPVRGNAGQAVSAAASQIGKPYKWGGAGPDSYDCSGLTMWAWARAGVSLPHSSRAQYASLPHVPLSELAPGDLVFYGRPIHHVGIYKGGGVMIAAPRSGQHVREESIYYSSPVGAARP